jgi:acyl-[acyl-carrier-protein]-phospholipid O-acyltransferase/long-chain-fatty-acid--[acyl-carrier-protein] ligase
MNRPLLGHLQSCVAAAALDNLFRMGINLALMAVAVASLGQGPEAERQSQHDNLLTMLVFNLPFILLAATAGSMGDRWPKHQIMRWARVADLGCIALSVTGMILQDRVLLILGMASFAVVSAVFAPVKLAVMPELTTAANLARANGWLAGLTVVAILLGTVLAGVHAPWGAAGIAVVATVLAVMGLHGAWSVGVLPARAPATPIAAPWRLDRPLAALRSAPGLWGPALGLAGFWSLGALAAVVLPLIAQFTYGLSPAVTPLVMLALALGMIAGSLLAPRLMHPAFPAGLPIFGALVAGGALVLAALDAVGHGPLPIFIALLVISGIGAGLWEVPVTVLLQERAPVDRRNAVMGAVTILASLGSVLVTLMAMALTSPWAQVSSVGLLGGVGAVTVAIAVILAWHYRIHLAGWFIGAVVRSLWNLHVEGMEHLPKTGGCLVVCNHLSYADGLAVFARLPRPGRFLIYRSFTRIPVLGPCLLAAGAIPVAAEDPRKALVASIEAAVAALKAGEVVLIFPEGKLTRSGTMDRFKSGLERIASRAGVPIIPAHLHGLYGTWMSRSERRDLPRLFRRVEFRLGAPLPSTATAAEARAAVVDLDAEAAIARGQRTTETLASRALALGRRHPLATAVRDQGGTLPLWKALAVARALLPHLNLAADESRVGVLLPPGRAGTLVNLALALDGRTAVNLNHTAGDAQVARMADIAGLKTVISAGLYLRKIGEPTVPGRLVRVEEILPRLGTLPVLLAAVRHLLLPTAWNHRSTPDHVAAIVFSSGSTGDPKGVQLTHRQVLANCRAVIEALNLMPFTDVLLSPLPLFHSFGLVPGMWLGLTKGLTIVAHPDPTDAKAIGELAAAGKATFTISTATFVRGWMRRIEPEQFKTLRFAVVGAEKCPPDLKVAFRERYGSELLEGYGCTELAPTVAVNLLTIRRDGEVEERHREGSVGRPLPGLAVVTIDPESHAVLPRGSEGLIVIRSPSRMLGYLGRDDLTAKAFVAGGYNTGDIGRVDEDGFIFITGRLARFAKIGGEMIPLDRIEGVLQAHAVTVNEDCEIAVAAVPDEGRGERLVVLTVGFTGPVDALLASLDACPPLWRPKARDVRAVEAIPKLGTGKRDLAGLKRLAGG